MKLNETFDPGFAFKEARVDPSTGMIRGVSLLGRQSKNGRTYSEQALRSAAKLHKGTQIFLDHPTEREEAETSVRRVRDLAGRVVEARVEGDRVRGDIQVLRGQGLPGELLLALAEQMPDTVGFSHRASGTAKRQDDGHEIIEDVDAVFGADIVTEPATVSGLFESYRKTKEPPEEPDEMDISKLTLSELKASRPDLLEAHDSAGDTQAKLAALEDENTKLKAFKEAAERKAAAAERATLVESKLKDADLPESLVSDAFKAQLNEAKDEAAVDALIEDRKAIWKEAQSKVGGSGPKSFERDVNLSEHVKPIDQDALAKGFDTIF